MSSQPAKEPRAGKRPGGSTGPTPPRLRFASPIGILLLLLAGFLLFRGLFENVGVRRVPYSEFVTNLEQGRFGRVVIGEGWVKGYPQAPANAEPSGETPGAGQAPLPWLANTVPGAEPALVATLERENVQFEAVRSSGMGVWDFTRILSVFIAAAWLVGMLNNAFLAPRSAAALSRLQDQLKTSQVSYEIQPRVFYEDFPNAVVYVQDVASTQRAATWRGVFLADVSKQGSPNITLAREGIVDGEQADHLQVHLTNGSTHETDPKKPDQNITSTFGQRDILIPIPPAAAQQKSVAATASETPTLWLPAVARQQKDPADTRTYLIEFHRRLALAAACIVLAMVGIPLGLSSKKGGKSTGFVLTITLVLLYYIISLFGISFARQGKMPPAAGIWMANVLFFLGGLFLLYRVDRMPIHIPTWRDSWSRLRQFIREHITSNISNARDAFERASHRPRKVEKSYLI
jgi:lipopolysaccharide export LptBFGC system permease protein LptF